MALSIVVGQSAAVMCHPLLAWKYLRPPGRFALVAGYAALTYVTSLTVLFTLWG